MAEKLRGEGLIESGAVFKAFHAFVDFAGSGTVLMLLRTPPTSGPVKRVFLDLQIQAEQLGILFIHEAPTISVDGTVVTPVNMRRGIVPEPALRTEVFHTPTQTDLGTQIFHTMVPAAVTTGFGARDYDPDREWILKTDTDYLLRYLDISAIVNTAVITAVLREEVVN